MTLKFRFGATVSAILVLCFGGGLSNAQNRNIPSSNGCSAVAGLSGMYQIDVDDSDKLYSVIESATSKVPYGEQQQFFMDLAVRLTPPDLLAIECRGNQIFLGSSRAPRIAFKADGLTRSTRASNGQNIQTRIRFEQNSLIFTSTGGEGEDKLNFSFTPIDGGARLRVTRQITAEELIEPVVIQTVYIKIDTVARWDIYGNRQVAQKVDKADTENPPPISPARQRTARAENTQAVGINRLLEQWIEATNRFDIEKQMSFYMPELKAFYLARNVSNNSVRLEKKRVFTGAKLIDIRADQPEIIFQDNEQIAVMRFRKKYRLENRSKIRRGEVIQELRWQKTNNGWKIFSERDIRVLS